MKPKLAFAGAILILVATGTLLSETIENRTGTQVSHPNIFSANVDHDPFDRAADSRFAPDLDAVIRINGAFIPNLGQVRHDIYFQFVSESELLQFRARSIRSIDLETFGASGGLDQSFEIQFIGANSRPEVAATEQAPSRMSFNTESESEPGTTASIPLFSKMRYRDLYDGIDMSVSASGSVFEPSFVINPGVDPSLILMRFENTEAKSNDLNSAESPLRCFQAGDLSAYQDVDGTRTPVAISHRPGLYGAFGFKIGAYDESLPLVIQLQES